MDEEVSTCYENVHKHSKDRKQTVSFCMRSFCFWLHLVLLVASIIIIIRISVAMYNQEAKLSDLTMKMKILKNQTEELIRKQEDLSRTIGVILTSINIPANDFCSGCLLCQSGWIHFQKKCYLFYDDTYWKTWDQSRQFCQMESADLVVIDDLQEQEFVFNHTKSYFDEFHGYWLGLYESGKNWLWIDGRIDTLGYWIKDSNASGPKALMLPQRKPTENWISTYSNFKNKFICEGDLLKVPN